MQRSFVPQNEERNAQLVICHNCTILDDKTRKTNRARHPILR